jgi:hypothetical protein
MVWSQGGPAEARHEGHGDCHQDGNMLGLAARDVHFIGLLGRDKKTMRTFCALLGVASREAARNGTKIRIGPFLISPEDGVPVQAPVAGTTPTPAPARVAGSATPPAAPAPVAGSATSAAPAPVAGSVNSAAPAPVAGSANSAAPAPVAGTATSTVRRSAKRRRKKAARQRKREAKSAAAASALGDRGVVEAASSAAVTSTPAASALGDVAAAAPAAAPTVAAEAASSAAVTSIPTQDELRRKRLRVVDEVRRYLDDDDVQCSRSGKSIEIYLQFPFDDEQFVLSNVPDDSEIAELDDPATRGLCLLQAWSKGWRSVEALVDGDGPPTDDETAETDDGTAETDEGTAVAADEGTAVAAPV